MGRSPAFCPLFLVENSKLAEVTLFFQQIGEPPHPHQGGVSTGLIASSFPGNWNSAWGGWGLEEGEYSPYQRWQMAIREEDLGFSRTPDKALLVNNDMGVHGAGEHLGNSSFLLGRWGGGCAWLFGCSSSETATFPVQDSAHPGKGGVGDSSGSQAQWAELVL